MREEKLREIKNYLEELKTISFDKLGNESKFLSIESYNCHLNNGNKIVREKLLKGKNDGSAAIIFAMTKDKEFILAIEPRVFTKETVDIGLPAGYIENDEKPIEAAKRELLEETGYEAEEFIPIGSYYQDQGCSSAYNHYFLATLLPGEQIHSYTCSNTKKDASQIVRHLFDKCFNTGIMVLFTN